MSYLCLQCQKLCKEDNSKTPYCSIRCTRRAQAQDIVKLGRFECRLCHVTQPLNNFEPSKQHMTGYETRCRTCRKSLHNDFLAKHHGYNSMRMALYPNRKQAPYDACRRAYRRQYYLNHKPEHAARDRCWRKRHPEQTARQRQVKAARKKGAPVIEKVDRLTIYLRDNWICQICFKKVRPHEATLDHIVPLSKGGEHTARNLVLAHHSCNSMKGNRLVTQQMRLFGQ